jgi:hypothetical protein
MGAYCGVETLRRNAGITDDTRDGVLLDALCSASRTIEGEVGRYFIPYTATNMYRWPQGGMSLPNYMALSAWTERSNDYGSTGYGGYDGPGGSWSWAASDYQLWIYQDLLSVSAITVATSGINATPVPVTHFYLEPQDSGPPYHVIEIDQSSQDAFRAGPTRQRAIAVTGSWGFGNDTGPAGSVLSGLASDTASTILNVYDANSVDLGDVLTFDDATTEAVYVSNRVGSELTIVRAVNGTTVDLHVDNTKLFKYQTPLDIRQAVCAEAIYTFNQQIRGYAYAMGAGDASIGYIGRTPEMDYRKRVVECYRRSRACTL